MTETWQAMCGLWLLAGGGSFALATTDHALAAAAGTALLATALVVESYTYLYRRGA